MKFNLKGSIPALVTPFHDDFTVNYEKLGELIEWHIEKGSAGILVLGTTGESVTITTDEQLAIVAYTVKKVAGRVHVMAGSGSNDTVKAINTSLAFEDLGVDSLLLITPYYNRTNDSGMIKHFELIANAVKIPTILYTVPSRTGCHLSVAVVAHLSKHDNIVGIKDATGDFSYSSKISRYVSEDFHLYSGNDDTIIPMMALGASGVISVWANVMPEVVSELIANYLDGAYDKALATYKLHLDFIDGLFIETSPIPLKYVMNNAGLAVGPVRLPLDELSLDAKKVVDKLMSEVSL